MSESQINNKRIAKNTIFLYIRLVVVMLISLFTAREVLSILGVEDYGVYNVVCGFVSMFSFLNTSMANGTQRFYNFEIGKNKGLNINSIFSHSLYIQIVVLLIILLIVETFGLWYLYNKMVIPEGRFDAACWIFQFSMLQLAFVMMSVPFSAAIMAYERMSFYAVLGILDAVLKLIIVLILPFISFDQLITYGALSVFISLINFLLNFGYCKKNFPHIKFQKGFDKTLFSKMFSFSGWNIFGSFSHMMQGQGINLVVNAFWGPIFNAANGIAAQVNSAVNSLTAGFLTATRPQMIQSYASGDVLSFKKMYYSTSKLTFYLVMILAVPLLFDLKEILDLWLGKGKYPELAVIFCQLTIISTMCNSYATPTSIVAHATGKMKKFQVFTSTVILMAVPISIVFAKMGMPSYAVILSNIIVNILAQITRLFIIKEQVNFSIWDYVKIVIFPTSMVVIALLLFAFAFHALTPNSVLWVLIRIITIFVIAISGIYAIGLDKSEKNLVLSLIKQKTKRK